MQYWLPTRPYSLIDAINRMAAAVGSPRYAMAASHANYNGHPYGFNLTIYGYWTTGYTWSGYNKIGQGTLAKCLEYAKRSYDMGHLGASVKTPDLDNLPQFQSKKPITMEEMVEAKAKALELGYVPWSKEIEEEYNKTWQDDRFALINDAFWNEKHLGIPAVSMLIKAASASEYQAQVTDMVAARHGNRATVR